MSKCQDIFAHDLIAYGLFYGIFGQLITTFVVRMAVMPFNPFPLYAVSLVQPYQFFPQAPVQYGPFLGSHPVFPDPSLNPFGHALNKILRVRDYYYFAGPFQLPQGLNHGHHLHPVICRVNLVPGQFLDVLTIFQYRPITAWARIAAAGPVGKDLDDISCVD